MKKHIHIKTLFGQVRLFIITAFLLVLSNITFAQAIRVLNIPDSDGSNPGGPGFRTDGNRPAHGYHLNGDSFAFSSMAYAKAKLTNLANFGPSGTVNRELTITDGFGTKGSITNISQLANYDIIFIGTYIRLNTTNNAAFTNAELNILLTWSKQPGKVLMVQEQADYFYFGKLSPVSSAMGYGMTENQNYPITSVLPADMELDTNLFSGVFGTATGTISQSGNTQGYFTAGCEGIPIAANTGGFPTMLLNQKYRDILVADIGYFIRLNMGTTPSGPNTIVGDMSPGGTITSDTDKVWANLWAWAVNEVVNQVAPGAGVTIPGEAYSDDLPMCGNSVTVELRNNNAPVVRWQTRTNSGGTWTDITPSNTSNSFVYNNPTAGQQFRAVLKNLYSSCAEVFSSPVTIIMNDAAPAVASSLNNICPVTTVNLASAHTGTAPAGTQIVWFTSNNTTTGTQLTAAQIAAAGAGTYYAFYQNVNNAACYSPASNAVGVTITSCCNAGNVAPVFNNYIAADYYYLKTSSSYGIICGGGATADLTVLVPSPAGPAGTTLTWHTASPATDSNKLTPAEVAAFAGATKKVYAAFWDGVCYSPTKTITVYAPICATDDDFTATPIIYGEGGILPSLFANDTYKTITLSTLPLNSVHWNGELWTHTIATVDLVNTATYGALKIDASAIPGDYEYMYSINDNSPDASPGLSKSTAYVKFRVICKAGETAPSVNPLLSNICPATTVNLDSAHTGTKPAGTDLVWFNSNNTTTGTQLTAAQVANAGAGTYYAFYYSTLGNCYSPASNAVTVNITNCVTCSSGNNFVDLNSLYTGTHPDAPKTVLEWWTTADRTTGTMVPDPTKVSQSGTYYAFFYDTVNKCYNTSNSTSSVVVNILPPCYCSKPGDFSVAGEPSKMGISVQKKESGWPENIPNGQIVLESKEKGFVITRVAHVSFVPETTDSVAEPFAGMLVYDIQDACVKLFNGVNWNCIKRSCNDIGN